jgi:hypothetical protein
MRIAVCSLESFPGSPYSGSKPHNTPMKDKESHGDFDLRTWREKAHYDDKTREVYIPAMAFKFALIETAKRLNLKISGRGQTTYAKSFVQGVLCVENVRLGIKVDDMLPVQVFCHADGKRGSGSRVMRTFPYVSEWSGVFTAYLVDDLLPKDVFEKVLKECGNLNGVGRFRAASGGTNGRFRVAKPIKWAEE